MECKIAHIEIPVKDINEAKKFYETIFNWKVQIETGFTDYAVLYNW
ncbi:MAG: VOC family protein [Candidatus Heimdallarchaeota archaeon]